jgi:pimeloyl-ACP methyl ester carboxylesterase
MTMISVFDTDSDAAPSAASGDHPSCDATVIALHCSGSDRNQWRHLGAALDANVRLIAPDLIGSGNAPPWGGERPFTLMDEARPIVDIIDGLSGPVHLVGHSYGGGVALKVACARPDRIASLTLYEPSAFHVLGRIGTRGGAEFAEIESLAAAVSLGVVSGGYQKAAGTFVDYWNGDGSWDRLRTHVRDGLVEWLPMAPLNFRALLNDDTPLECYQRLAFSALVMRGEHARGPSRLVAAEVARRMPVSRIEIIRGAGHMGPVTHSETVIEQIVTHIRSTSSRTVLPAGTGPIAA